MVLFWLHLSKSLTIKSKLKIFFLILSYLISLTKKFTVYRNIFIKLSLYPIMKHKVSGIQLKSKKSLISSYFVSSLLPLYMVQLQNLSRRSQSCCLIKGCLKGQRKAGSSPLQQVANYENIKKIFEPSASFEYKFHRPHLLENF